MVTLIEPMAPLRRDGRDAGVLDLDVASQSAGVAMMLSTGPTIQSSRSGIAGLIRERPAVELPGAAHWRCRKRRSWGARPEDVDRHHVDAPEAALAGRRSSANLQRRVARF